MSAPFQQKQARIVSALVVGGISFAAWQTLGYPPVFHQGNLNALPSLAIAGMGISGLAIAADGARLFAKFVDWRKAKTPTGLKGTAGWASYKDIRSELVHKGWGPFWGTLNGRELIADWSSNAITVAPAGAGKFIYIVANQVLSIRESKFVVDLKGEIACVTAKALATRGENVHVINLADLFLDQLGPYDAELNILDLIAENFSERRNGLLDVSNDVHELSMLLIPEPKNTGSGSSDNSFFRDGSRRIIQFCVVTAIIVEGKSATLASVYTRLMDKNLTRQEAQWVAGQLRTITSEASEEAVGYSVMPIETLPWVNMHDPEVMEGFLAFYRPLAIGMADLYGAKDERNLLSFLEGARSALMRFNPSTRAHRKTQRTTVALDDLKRSNKPTTIFLVSDSTRNEALKDLVGLFQWALVNTLKRAEDKKRPVYLIADECTNFVINELGSILTFGRGYGLRLHLIFQSFAAFIRVYGKDVFSTALSETEVKCFLPGQREPEILEYLEKQLAQQSVMVRGNRTDKKGGAFGLGDYDLREEARPLLTADEISRLDRPLIRFRSSKWVKADKPISYAQIAPFKRLADINPFHGAPFIKRTKLNLTHRDGSLLIRIGKRLLSLLSNR